MYTAKKYYISDHYPHGVLLHCSNCPHLPAIEQRTFIGSCYTVNQARTVASMHFSGVSECPFCLDAALPSVQKAPRTSKARTVVLTPPKRPERKVPEKKYQPVKHLSTWR